MGLNSSGRLSSSQIVTVQVVRAAAGAEKAQQSDDDGSVRHRCSCSRLGWLERRWPFAAAPGYLARRFAFALIHHTVNDSARFVQENRLGYLNCYLRLSVTLVGGLAVPAGGLGVVLRHSFAVGVHKAEVDLSAGAKDTIPLVCGFAIPADGFWVILRQPLAFLVHKAERKLSVGVPMVGACPQYLERLLSLVLARDGRSGTRQTDRRRKHQP